jgi:hypothetical protein
MSITVEVGEAARSTLETEGSRDEQSSRLSTTPSASGIGSLTVSDGTAGEPNENPESRKESHQQAADEDQEDLQ